MKSWRINELGLPWEKCQVEETVLPDIPEGGCRVKVEATDLNFADILQCQGKYQVRIEPPFTPGMSAAGLVTQASKGSKFGPGDRIVGPTFQGSGGYAEEALVLADRSTRVPEGVLVRDAVAMHVTYGTAWFGLHLRGLLQPGETVLVLAAAGGVGAAAVELAKVHGCWVIAAAGSQSKLETCSKLLGADEVIDYNNEDLYQRVMELTDGRGVDVVYDPVGGDYFNVARRLVAWEGRYLVIGFAAGDIPSAPMNHALVKNYSIVGVHMGGYRGRDETYFERCYGELFSLLSAGEIHPLVDDVVGFDGLGGAFLNLYERKTRGRILFDPSL
jgi:NADPH2:quinone reductase